MDGVLYPMKFAQFIGNIDHMKYNLRPYKNVDIASVSKKTSVSSRSNANTGAPSVLNEKIIKVKIKDGIELDNQALANKGIVNQSSSTVMSQKERVDKNEQHAGEHKYKTLESPNRTQQNQDKKPRAIQKETPITLNQSNTIPKATVSENNIKNNKNESEQNIQMLANNTAETEVKLSAPTENKEIVSDVVQKEAAEVNSTNDKNEQEILIAKTKKLENITHLNTAPKTPEKPNTPAPNYEKPKIQQTQNIQSTETTNVGIGAKIKNFFSKFL